MGVGVVIKRQYADLASAESTATVVGWEWWKKIPKNDSGVLYFPKARRAPRNLGLARYSFRVLANGEPKNIKTISQSVSWKKVLRGKSHRVTLTNRSSKKISEKEVAKIIGEAIGDASRAKMTDPDVIIDVVWTDEQILLGTRTWTDQEEFEKRRAHLLPAPHPTSAHPSVARALLNLACATRIHDPLCGSGGFLIEGGLLGKHISGGDLLAEMVVRARKNTAAFHLRPEIRVVDATVWVPRVSAIVTDMPYGKSTKAIDAEKFLEAFLTRASQSTRRIILGSNGKIHVTKQWAIRASFSFYVHKSMNRYFYVLERK